MCSLHCKNDMYFYGKNRLNLHGRDVRHNCTDLFSQLSLKCPRDRYLLCLFHFYKKNAFQWTDLAGVFVCYKYVTDMLYLTYLFTNLPYFFRKNTDRFHRVNLHFLDAYSEKHIVYRWKDGLNKSVVFEENMTLPQFRVQGFNLLTKQERLSTGEPIDHSSCSVCKHDSTTVPCPGFQPSH